MDADGKIHFEWQPFGEFKIVALDAKLSDFKGIATLVDGVPMMKTPEMTVKDCRNIDGCVYYCLGRKKDSEIIPLIEMFQSELHKIHLWKPSVGIR